MLIQGFCCNIETAGQLLAESELILLSFILHNWLLISTNNLKTTPMDTELTQFSFLWLLAREILVGTALLLVVLIFHGSAINHVIMRFERQTTNNLAYKAYNWIFIHFYVAFIFIALIHIFEVLIWAFFLLKLGLISNVLLAVIFSGSCYTTVGFATDNLPYGWRTLAFFITFTGLFSLAWTTSAMIGMTNIYREAWKAKYLRGHH